MGHGCAGSIAHDVARGGDAARVELVGELRPHVEAAGKGGAFERYSERAIEVAKTAPDRGLFGAHRRPFGGAEASEVREPTSADCGSDVFKSMPRFREP